MALINREELRDRMYHEAFEVDSKLQKWDSGCWIRYKLFEKILDETPIVESRPTSEWIDYSEDGYVECPFCQAATNCDDNIEDLNYCFSCGAQLEGTKNPCRDEEPPEIDSDFGFDPFMGQFSDEV